MIKQVCWAWVTIVRNPSMLHNVFYGMLSNCDHCNLVLTFFESAFRHYWMKLTLRITLSTRSISANLTTLEFTKSYTQVTQASYGALIKDACVDNVHCIKIWEWSHGPGSLVGRVLSDLCVVPDPIFILITISCSGPHCTLLIWTVLEGSEKFHQVSPTWMVSQHDLKMRQKRHLKFWQGMGFKSRSIWLWEVLISLSLSVR